jgi:leader peptidase (prepilin peptidase)/N-methyltransferase
MFTTHLFSLFVLIPLFLCWGSFLSNVGYRIVRRQNFIVGRSRCTSCRKTLAWYDLIPIFSWVVLKGRCRYCKASISFLYPCIEILTALVFTLMVLYLPPLYFGVYFIFFSALLITIRSDLETMLISRYVTLFLVPLGFLLSTLGLLPISLADSLAGAFGGYALLWGTAKLFFLFTRKEGIGQGDVELLAFIGSFTGFAGAWLSLLLGSLAGSLLGITYIAITHSGRNAKIPFGPFLALGAICYIFLREPLLKFMLGL